ncbi:ketoacyl-ACP synthase III family protein [Streptomyces sp. NPDC017991]|uniref:ketoacyl-ACP synthase III family protein n=1 Tax=Streptomyces sp. NPDC017991 TaxID=3365026 RepID=UPI0037B639CB
MDDVYLSGIGGYVPADRTTVREAVADGRYEQVWNGKDRLESVAVETLLSPAEMAVRAGRQALLRSGHRPQDVSLLLHATAYRQGPEAWAAASYVERYTVAAGAPALEIRQGCNGGMFALDLARNHLGQYADTAVLITCADRFDGEFDRWRTNKGMVFGDGAAAVVMSRRRGVARVLGIATRADSELEQMHRGEAPLASSTLRRGPLDAGPGKKAFLRTTSSSEVQRRFEAQVVAAVDRALSEAGTKLDAIAQVLVSNLGHEMLTRVFLEPLGLPVERTAWRWGRRIGHLANSDQFLALEHQLRTGVLHEGDLVLLVGMGVGFVWTATVLEIAEQPVRTH